jgi:predicted nucleic acid-binding protein
LTLLDAYGLVALLADEEAAAEVEKLLREEACLVVAVNLAEAADIAARLHAYSLDEIRGALTPLFLGRQLTLEVSSEREAWLAAEIRAAEYHRKQRPLSMADCFLLAHAISSGVAIASSDPHVAVVARSRGVTVHGLPDRDGNRP